MNDNKQYISKKVLKKITASYDVNVDDARELIETSCKFIKVNYSGNPQYKKMYWNELNTAALWVLVESEQKKPKNDDNKCNFRIEDAINDLEECEKQLSQLGENLVCVIEDFEELIEMCTEKMSMQRFDIEWEDICAQYTDEQMNLFKQLVQTAHTYIQDSKLQTTTGTYVNDVAIEIINEVEAEEMRLKLKKRMKYLVNKKLQ